MIVLSLVQFPDFVIFPSLLIFIDKMGKYVQQRATKSEIKKG
jgi:hypothetical protein